MARRKTLTLMGCIYQRPIKRICRRQRRAVEYEEQQLLKSVGIAEVGTVSGAIFQAVRKEYLSRRGRRACKVQNRLQAEIELRLVNVQSNSSGTTK
jgi:type II secretory ATPase GspE/PulE/Tfp pilus assembly ATPase PilB-like protein